MHDTYLEPRAICTKNHLTKNKFMYVVQKEPKDINGKISTTKPK